MKLCECGCGNPIRIESNRFISGHQFRGHSAWNKGKTKETDERVAKQAKKLTGRIRSKTHCDNISKAKLGKSNNHKIDCECPFCRDKHGENNSFYGKHHTKRTKKIIGMKNSRPSSMKGKKNLKVTGELNPAYVNGYWMTRSKHILQKKNYCEKCGNTDELQIHHIPSMNEENCLTWNGTIKTLCEHCHKLEHKNKITRKFEVIKSVC